MCPVPLFPDDARSNKESDGSELGCLLETWSAMTCMTLITNSQSGFPVIDDFKSAFDAVHRGLRRPSTQMESAPRDDLFDLTEVSPHLQVCGDLMTVRHSQANPETTFISSLILLSTLLHTSTFTLCLTSPHPPSRQSKILV
jgi:hypothetical protein